MLRIGGRWVMLVSDWSSRYYMNYTGENTPIGALQSRDTLVQRKRGRILQLVYYRPHRIRRKLS